MGNKNGGLEDAPCFLNTKGNSISIANKHIVMALNLDSTIADLLREKPESAAILQSFGMGCLGCAIANNETIREAAMVHGIPLEELAAKLGF